MPVFRLWLPHLPHRNGRPTWAVCCWRTKWYELLYFTVMTKRMPSVQRTKLVLTWLKSAFWLICIKWSSAILNFIESHPVSVCIWCYYNNTTLFMKHQYYSVLLICCLWKHCSIVTATVVQYSVGELNY